MTTVALVGGDPAAAAVRAALSDTDATVLTSGPDGARTADLAIAVGQVGSDGFQQTSRIAREAKTPWFAVELGGVGGRLISGLDAAISGFVPSGACFDCLRTRVAANSNNESGSAPSDADAPSARFAGALAGREATRLLTGEGSPAIGGVLEVPHAHHPLLPVPYCVCAAGRDVAVRREEENRSLDEALAAAERALDPRVGAIREVGEVESFPAPYYLATLAETNEFSDAAVPRHAAGVAADWDRAFMKALGEALERYAAATYRTAEFEQGPPDAVDGAVRPDAFVRPDGRDREPTDERWIEAEHLSTGEVVRLPAEFVVFPPPIEQYRPAITTGLGLGNSGSGALLSGLYEVIERDAAMLAWYSTFEPLGLEVDHGRYETLEARVRSERLTATALLLTADVDVPVVAACLHRDGDWPRFAAGMAANLDAGAAAAAALEEAVQNFLELRGMGPEEAAEEPGAIGHYADFPPTAREFVSPETTVPVSSVGPDAPPDGRSELDTLIGRVETRGLDAYATRLTTRDLETLGFEAVRVVLPAAQPLFTGEAYFGDRAETVPRELGFEPRLDREHHPFP